MHSPRLITSISELDALLAASNERPVFIFKHSLTCPISATARHEYQRFVDHHAGAGTAELTLVEIQNARSVSEEIARRTGVRHESPQALLLHRGKPVWDASHFSIREKALDAALEKVAG